MSSDFVHLHVHTEYSLLDGRSRISELMERASELEMPAIGITDHGVMFGVVDFYRAAKAQGLHPVIGMEAYLAPRKRTDKEAKEDKRPYHMLLLAKNMTGYRNLMRLASIAQLEGYYYRPRIDWDVMAAHSEGLIATSGCLAAEIPRLVEDGKEDEARAKIGRYQEVFGPDNFYLELQPHDIPALHRLNHWLFQYRKSGHTNVQFYASNDVHYVRREDHETHDTLLCIQTSATKDEPNRMRMQPKDAYYLKTADEMRRSFGDAPPEMIREAFANTLKIARMTEVNLDTDQYHLPVFPVPPGHDSQSYLRYLTEKGRNEWRYVGRENDALLNERIERELRIINDMGFNTYFLIVWDLCEFSRQADIWWNVRGSGAGSVVAYCLGITNIDPIQNNLLFERFLNPGRVSMPDIDLDYPDDQRGEMIAYAARKYGKDKVAAIITFGTLGAKAAVRDVGRAMAVDPAKVNFAAGLIPQEARQKKIRQYIDNNPELTELYNADPEIKQVMDTAMDLQGLTRHASTHAAGVIIADKPLVEYVPLHRITGKDPSGGALDSVTQFPMETAESLGLLKVDFLGLSTLTIMRKACELIAQHRGIHYTMDNIPYRHDDPLLTEEQRDMLDETFELLGRGETVGVFQLESTGMQSMLRGMKPRKFEHIIAGISLYRPGPMEFIPKYNDRLHGREPSEYLHPKLEPILAETMGIIVYQEQIMQIAGELFGYDLGEADLMRRAVSKKKQKALLEHKAIFIERGPQNGISAEDAEKIFEEIEFFANYGFNKSHASDYAVITVQTAFLKTHYPEEYMTALLCVQYDDGAKVAAFLEECRRMQIPVLPPHINNSAIDFDIEVQADGTPGIRFGLGAIKNAGVAALQHIVDAREADGAFRSLVDFCQRVDLRQVGKRAIESLIKVGAFAGFGKRDNLLASLDRLHGFSVDHHVALESGQKSLFADMSEPETLVIPDLPISKRVKNREMLLWEKELLGLYVTGRPVDRHREVFESIPNLANIAQLKAGGKRSPYNGVQVRVAGEIVDIRKVLTKNSETMVILQFEDWHESASTLEVVIFPRTWAEQRESIAAQKRKQNREENATDDNLELAEGDILLIVGKYDTSREDPQIICEHVSFNFEAHRVRPDTYEQHKGDKAPAWVLDDDESAWHAYQDDAYAYYDEPTTISPSATELHQQKGQGNGETERPSWQLSADTKLPSSNTPNLFDQRNNDERPPMHIVVHIRNDPDADRFKRRFKRVIEHLESFPGRDTYSLVVHSLDGGQRPIDFPEKRTGYNDELRKKLRAFVDPDGIEIIEPLKNIERTG